MGYLEGKKNQSYFTIETLGSDIPEDHESRFIKEFIKDKFSFLDKQTESKEGRPAFKKTSLLALLIYAEYDDITDYEKISKYCDANKYYNYIMDGLVPKAGTIQQFMREYGYVFEFVNKFLLLQLENQEFTSYNTVKVYARILKKSDNYIIDTNDIQQLERLLEKNPSKEKINKLKTKLSETAYLILTNMLMTKDEKELFVKLLKKQLETTDKKKLKLDSKDVTEMLNNKKEIRLSYNKDFRTGYNSKLITRLYLEPNTLDIDDYIIEDKDSKKLSVDLKRFKKDKESSIKEKSSTKIDSAGSFIDYYNKNNSNDKFRYNFKNDTYLCAENKQLPLQKTVTEKSSNSETPSIIKKIYTYTACGNCQYIDECEQKTVREITDYKNMSPVIDPEISKNSILIENRLNLKIVTYNLKRILNIESEVNKKNRHLVLFMNQLKKENPDIKFIVNIN